MHLGKPTGAVQRVSFTTALLLLYARRSRSDAPGQADRYTLLLALLLVLLLPLLPAYY